MAKSLTRLNPELIALLESGAAGDLDEVLPDMHMTPTGPQGTCTMAGQKVHVASVVEEAAPHQGVTPEGHRGRSWNGGNVRSEYLCEIIRQQQMLWAKDHPDQRLTWSFPVRRRESFKINLRSVEKMERLQAPEFRTAFTELVGSSLSGLSVRYICFIYMNYLYPFHANIQSQGRHLLILKMYEDRNEAHCWWMPMSQVLDVHKGSAVMMDSGISLNDVQLVQTYEVGGSFAVHCETFSNLRSILMSNKRGSSSNQYGECVEASGAVIHLVYDDLVHPAFERAREFASMPVDELAAQTEKKAKLREKRTRKKKNQAAKKAEAKEQQQQEKAQEALVAQERRKENLVKPHESLGIMFRGGVVDDDSDSPSTNSGDE